ncbi:MAG TPA: hypothetical protein VK272_07005 [Solirubrobacteraceae bacterium]|nr:hypothetical protein [Solirubrobacteraceae bacterium]
MDGQTLLDADGEFAETTDETLTFEEGAILFTVVQSRDACSASQVAKVTGLSLDVVKATLDELRRRDLVHKI